MPTEEEFLADLEMLLARPRWDETDGLKCAAFLTSLWDGREYGVGLSDALVVSSEVMIEMLTVIAYLHVHCLNLVDIVEPQVMQTLQGYVSECLHYHSQ